MPKIIKTDKHRNQKWEPASGRGMSLVEYGLVGALGFCVCVGTLITVGDQMASLLSGIKQDMRHRVENGKMIKTSLASLASPVSSAEVSGTVAKGSLKVNPNNPDELCSQDGWCVKAPGLTGDAVYTTGSNGMQDLSMTAADVYAQMAEIASKEGEDPELVSLLTEMSLKGYAMASLQSQLSATTGLLQIGFLADGITQTMGNLQGQLGEFSGMSQRMNMLAAKLPPDQRAILGDAAKVIIAVANSYSLQSYHAYEYGYYGYGYDSPAVAVGFTSSKVDLTSTNSETICNNGGDRSKCGQGGKK